MICAPMSATMPDTWFWARNCATRSRWSLGKTTLKRLSNEKNTEVDMQARNITQSIEFLAMMRSPAVRRTMSSPNRARKPGKQQPHHHYEQLVAKLAP